MAQIADMPLSLRLFVRTYPWRRVDPVPCARLGKPLSACRVALVTSAGFVAVGQPAFDETVLGGDYTYRVIPAGEPLASLAEHHRSTSFDHAGISADRNLGLPLDRLRELVGEGVLGEVAPRHLSFMGSITAPGRLVKRTAPEAAALLVEDFVDVALLVPV